VANVDVPETPGEVAIIVGAVDGVSAAVAFGLMKLPPWVHQNRFVFWMIVRSKLLECYQFGSPHMLA